jgi:CheY-like chemotaxis protein
MTSSLVPNQQRVLVADDERIIADTLQTILSRHGFEVIVAYEGKAAIEKARQFRPQIFLCDVMMPGMNGLEAAIQILAFTPECRVLLFSAQTSVFDLIQEARFRGHEFQVLLKPVQPSELLDRLRSLD